MFLRRVVAGIATGAARWTSQQIGVVFFSTVSKHDAVIWTAMKNLWLHQKGRNKAVRLLEIPGHYVANGKYRPLDGKLVREALFAYSRVWWEPQELGHHGLQKSDVAPVEQGDRNRWFFVYGRVEVHRCTAVTFTGIPLLTKKGWLIFVVTQLSRRLSVGEGGAKASSSIDWWTER